MNTETTTAIETADDIDTSLFTGSPEELAEATGEATELSLEEIVRELVTTETNSPYGIAKIINQVFEVTGNDKRIPPQMMYNYALKGMIVKGEKGRKVYTRDETVTYVTKYTGKHTTV
jgi:hypothetical protein